MCLASGKKALRELANICGVCVSVCFSKPFAPFHNYENHCMQIITDDAHGFLPFSVNIYAYPYSVIVLTEYVRWSFHFPKHNKMPDTFALQHVYAQTSTKMSLNRMKLKFNMSIIDNDSFRISFRSHNNISYFAKSVPLLFSLFSNFQTVSKSFALIGQVFVGKWKKIKQEKNWQSRT